MQKHDIDIGELSGEVKLNIKPITLPYGESDMNKYLFDQGSKELLKSHGLELPSYYRDKSLKELMEAYEKSTEILSDYKDSIKNVAKYNYKIISGMTFAYPDKGDDAKLKSKEKIRKYNIMEIYKYDLDQLRVFKETRSPQGLYNWAACDVTNPNLSPLLSLTFQVISGAPQIFKLLNPRDKKCYYATQYFNFSVTLLRYGL